MRKINLNIKKVKEAIRRAADKVGRNQEEVKLVTVTKTVDVDRIKEVIDAGLNIFGENRIQEARKKSAELSSSIQWHLIGHLQSNKIKYIFDQFALIHSVDSLSLAEEIQKKAERIGKAVSILAQINTSGELTKFGISYDKAVSVVKEINKLKNLNVMGLMTIPPYSENPENSRVFYKRLKSVKMELAIEKINLPELSMGMSNDYEVAIEEGATIIRVGTAIFGPRVS